MENVQTKVCPRCGRNLPYVSMKNGNYYVREEKQFFDKFITLKEWENK